MIFNWNIPLNNGVNQFKAYLVLPKETGDNKVEEFKIPTRKEKKLESRYLDLDKWYGCLYYDIIPVKKGKSKIYTLLGYSPEKKALTKKYIDVLTIRNGQPRLGEAIFEGDKGLKKRVVFEFSAEVSMAVRYQAGSDRIILDHLTPRSPEMAFQLAMFTCWEEPLTKISTLLNTTKHPSPSQLEHTNISKPPLDSSQPLQEPPLLLAPVKTTLTYTKLTPLPPPAPVTTSTLVPPLT